MNKKNYWLEFEKSGFITDYLNYVACTSEHMGNTEEENNQVREGGYGDFTRCRDRDGTGCDASW
ncbi:hypothetical protein [Anaerosporobacter faecicola]|uniref:hypothetical protein n=1 Tax=Anaerosporobacter faecicola TaxID=2718714 RepID=UPI00143976CC|nr:hypothetical protein [Anaerosporobacter faecicola]